MNMSRISSNLIESQNAINSKVLPSSLGGRVRIAHGSVIPNGGLAGTVIELVRLPRGSRVLPCSTISFEAGQSESLTVKVGDVVKTDRYMPVVAPGSAATSLMFKFVHEHVLQRETLLLLTTGGGPLAGGRKITFDILYVVD